jgi:hypothetical protein
MVKQINTIKSFRLSSPHKVCIEPLVNGVDNSEHGSVEGGRMS